LWNKDLEDHVNSFIEQAREVKQFDTQLRENGNRIIELHNGVLEVNESQTLLGNELETIKRDQEYLSQMIKEIEKAVEKSNKRNNRSKDELNREKAYKLAEDIDGQLMQMSDTIKETVIKLNRSSEQNIDPRNSLSQIVKILNNQVTALQWIESKSEQLETKLQKAQVLVKKTKSRMHPQS